MPVAATIFIGSLLAMLVAACAVLLPRLDAGDPWGTWAILTVLLVAAGFVQLTYTEETRATGQAAVAVAAALLLPPELVLLAAPFAVSGISRDSFRDVKKLAFNVADLTLAPLAAWGAAALVFAAAGEAGWTLLAAGSAATAAHLLANQVPLAVVLRLAEGLPLRRFPLFTVEYEFGAFGAAALGIAFAGFWETNPWLLLTLAAPVALAVRAFRIPQLRDAVRLEPKTGLFNSSHFDDALRDELARAQRFNRPLAVLMVDLDYLRDINNAHGHLAGDGVILGVATILRAQLRSVDVASRFGGEEFALLLPETTPDDAAAVAERVRNAVAAAEFGSGIRASVSIGVAGFPRDGATPDELVEAADKALYAAKGAGRNRVSAPGAATLAPA